jgi:hypothetical protein
LKACLPFLREGDALVVTKPDRLVRSTGDLLAIGRARRAAFSHLELASDTMPVPVGGFVRRVARTPHYDGVKRDAKGPAIIAISGIGPIHYHLTDMSQPGWRKV